MKHLRKSCEFIQHVFKGSKKYHVTLCRPRPKTSRIICMAPKAYRHKISLQRDVISGRPINIGCLWEDPAVLFLS
jgi:hypothetical protein